MLANRRHEADVHTGDEFSTSEPRTSAAGLVAESDSLLRGTELGRKPVASARPTSDRHTYLSHKLTERGVFEPLLDLHEAAAILGMHWKTLEAKARLHQVPALKVGKRWRFRLSSLNSWLEDGINSNTTDHAVVTRQERCS